MRSDVSWPEGVGNIRPKRRGNMAQKWHNWQLRNDDSIERRTWTMFAKQLWKLTLSILQRKNMSAADEKQKERRIIGFRTYNFHLIGQVYREHEEPFKLSYNRTH